MTQIQNFAERPEIAPALASLPASLERDAATKTYTGAIEALTRSRHRLATIEQRRTGITAELADATTARQRDSLIAEQTALLTELNLLPGVISLQAQTYAESLIRWHRIAKADLVRACNGVTDQLNDVIATREPHRRVLFKASGSTRAASEMADQVKSARSALATSSPRVEELTAQRNHLDRALKFIDIAVSGPFGDAARTKTPRPVDVDRFVKRVVALKPAA